MIISRSFEFDAAHRLDLPYKSKCSNVHGHRYKVIVHLKDEWKSGNAGMVLDFSKIKEIVQEKIIDEFDHKTILNDNKVNMELIKVLKSTCGNESIVLMPFNPTAENFAVIFYERLKDEFDLLMHKVEVYETPTSRSCYP